MIWPIHLDRYRIDRHDPRPTDEGWTGAEIESCCRLAALMDQPLVDAARLVVPVSVTDAEEIASLRNWAAGRCIDADTGTVYSHAGGQTPRRSITRRSPTTDPGNN